jgi:predicted nucleotidyltransferase
MINLDKFLPIFTSALESSFPERVYFIGLQGSYARGEATETSDIDLVVIFDKLTFEDIRVYNSMLDTLPHRELICGFISGKEEILNWEPSDLFQFYHDTKTIKGSLDELLLLIDKSAVDHAIKIGACNIYHGCVHNMLHNKSDDILRGLYKSASFVLQAVCFKNNGRYIGNIKVLSETLSGTEKEIIDTFCRLKNGADVDFDKMSDLLFVWAKKLITEEK